MIISRGSFTRTIQPVQSSNDTGIYLGNTEFMTDGIASTGCSMQWPSGAQSPSVWMQTSWQMVPAPTQECRVFAMLGVVGIPEGTFVELYGGATSNPSTLLTGGYVARLPNGDLGVWIVRDIGEGWVHEYFGWRIYNDAPGGNPIVASSIYRVGEVYASPAWDWCLTDMAFEMTDPSVVNTSAGGASRRVKWTPYRSFSGAIAPKGWDVAFIDATNGLQAFQYDLQSQDNIAVIPRPRWPPGGDLNQTSIEQTAMLGVLTRIGNLASNAQSDRWPLQIGMQESI